MRRALPWAAALVGTVLFHRWTILSGFDTVQADAGDSRYIAAILEHWNAVAHGVARAGSPLMFWPVGGTLGYSDALAGMGAVHVALRALGLGVFEAMNVQLVLLTFGSFWAAYLFIRRGFRLGVVAATVGASFYAFSWPRFAVLVHPQLLFTVTLPPMGLLLLECLRDGPGLSRPGFAWRVCGFVALLALTMATAVYYAEFALLLAAACVLPTLCAPRAWGHYGAIARRHWPGLLAGVALLAACAVPIARVYLPVMRQSGGRDWATVAAHLLDPVDYLWMGRENAAWGWLHAGQPVRTEHNWSDTRIGTGLVATAAWLAALAAAVVALLRRRPGRVAALVVLGGAGMELLALRVGGHSLWWGVFEAFPGMGGLRSISRVVLVATLPMALGIALLVERVPRRWAAAAAALVGLGAVEQLGAVQLYSARDADALAQRVADAIPRSCRAAYVVAPPGLLPMPAPITDEARFDAARYLRANPDVAAGWSGTAWQHYVAFGRAEHRSLDPDWSALRGVLAAFYNYTVSLSASLAGVPVANGISGWQPPGWDLFDVFSPEAPAKLAAWARLNGRDPAVICLVPVALPPGTLPTVELRY